MPSSCWVYALLNWNAWNKGRRNTKGLRLLTADPPLLEEDIQPKLRPMAHLCRLAHVFPCLLFGDAHFPTFVASCN